MHPMTDGLPSGIGGCRAGASIVLPVPAGSSRRVVEWRSECGVHSKSVRQAVAKAGRRARVLVLFRVAAIAADVVAGRKRSFLKDRLRVKLVGSLCAGGVRDGPLVGLSRFL